MDSVQNEFAAIDIKQGVNTEHDFSVQTWKEDFCLVVEGKRLYVARMLLALASPVFERMFQSSFKEKDQYEIELPGKLAEDVEEFLKCIYPSILKEVTMKSAFRIIALAEEYQVVTLKEKCESCFLSAVNKTSSIETLCRILKVAYLYSLSNLSEKCLNLAAERSITKLDKAIEKYSLPPTAVCAIQRKVIDAMGRKEAESNQVIDKLLHNQKKMDVFYKYHRAGVKKSEVLEPDDFVGWDCASLYKKIDTQTLWSHTLYSSSIDICNTKLCFEFTRTLIGRISLTVSAKEADVKKFIINLVGNIVIFNGMAGKEHFCQKIEMQLRTNKYEHTLGLLEGIDLETTGYIYNGEICVECNILANIEPIENFQIKTRYR